VTTTRRLPLTALTLALASASCGTTGKQTATKSPSNEEMAENPTAVFKAQAKKPEAAVSDDQRAEFDKAVATYTKLRKGGLKSSDCDDAAAPFRRLADDNPAMLIARHNEASVYLECGKKQEGMRIEEDLARKGYAPALATQGQVAYESGDVGQAETYCNRAIQADPQIGSVNARLVLAQILGDKARRASGSEQQKYASDAGTEIHKVLALDGNNLQAYATLCEIYYYIGRPDAAVLIGTQSIKRAQEIATGKFEDETVAETVNREKAVTTRRGKGGKKEEKGEAEARPTHDMVGTGWTSDMKRSIAAVHNTMGLVALDKKPVIYSDAIASFKKAVELNPELNEARLNLAALSLRFRDYNTAEENFRAVATDKNSAVGKYEAVIGLGVALRGNRKYDDAEQQYLTAMKIEPGRSDSYFNLGLLYQEYKGSDKPTLQKAQQYYRDFLSHNPPSRQRKDAEKRIKDIDELFVALEEAAKLQKEAEEIQKKAEEQQQKMMEEMKKQEQQEKGGPAPAPAPGGETAPPPATTPPPAGTAPPASK